jgi:hypothetical protein
MIDLKHPKCIECKTKHPVFGLPDDKKATYCGDCKKEGMIDVKSPRCIECKTKHPVFGLPDDKKATYCGACKKEGMIDVKSAKCIECKTTRAIEKYENYCAWCFMHLFPDKPMARNRKTKESAVVQYTKEHFPNMDIVTDKRIYGGCSNRRPDILFDLGEQIIIIEVDENQHTDYDCSCESKRVMELSLDVGHRPIVFIRFNPDDYNTSSKKITSCWSINKNGICTIKKNKQIEWNERLDVLRDTVTYWIEHRTNKTIEEIALIYDE